MEGDLREEHLGLIIANGRVDNDIVTLVPVNWRGYAMFVAKLQRVHNTENLIKVSSGRSRISNGQANDFLGVNYEYSADRKGKALCITVSRILLIKHIIEGGDFPVLVGNDGELHVGWSVTRAEVVDIFDPLVVVFEAIGRNSNEFDIALSKVISAASDLAKLSGADWCKVSGMREENRPRVANPFVELDRASSSLCFKIGGNVSEAKGGHRMVYGQRRSRFKPLYNITGVEPEWSMIAS